MPDLSSFTQGTSDIASSDFLIGYVSAAGPGSERRWTAQDLTTGLLSLAGATPGELAHLSGTTGNIQSQLNAVQSDVNAHEARTDNPHTVTAAQVGLGSVDNTSDTDKPVSTLQQAAIDAAGGGAFDADANTQITPATPIVLGQATGNETALTLDYTTNKATSGDDTGLLINMTDTQSPGASSLVDLQVGGVSQFSVDSAGEVSGPGASSRLRLTDSVGAELQYSSWRFSVGGTTAYFYQTTIAKVGMGVDGLRLADSGALRWSSGSQASTGHDLFLSRDSAATLQLGVNHATVATGQTIKAHDVVTGTGADLTLSGGSGDAANGDVIVSHGGSESFRATSLGLTTGGLTHTGRVWKDLTIGSDVHGAGGGINIVAGASGDSGVYFARGTTGADRFRGFLFYDHSNDTFALGSNGVTAVTLDSTQNVGIGTTTPNANAILDVSSTTKAFLPPRMTTTEKNAVASPTAGMLVYDSTLNKLAVYTGAAWEAITSA